MSFSSLYYWDDPAASGLIFGSVLVTLVSLCYYSLLSVLSYGSLTVLITVSLLKLVTYMATTFAKKDLPCVGDLLVKAGAADVTLPADDVQQLATKITDKANCAIVELRRLFLVENMLESIKFGLSMWCLTYIGSWFNAMTLVILFWAGLFTLPKIYLNNQEKIDPVLDQVSGQLNDLYGKVSSVLPKTAAGVVPPVKKED